MLYSDKGKGALGLAVLLVSLICAAGEPLEIRIGALLTSGRCCTYQSYEDKASALTMAIDQLDTDGVLNKSQVTFK